MRRTAIFLLFMALFLRAGAIYASDAASLARKAFYRGNDYYQQGNYDASISSYQEALNRGIESGPLYYNLGNAYMKKGQPGKAILNYMRAERFLSGDADLESNLSYARSLIEGGRQEPKESVPFRIFSSFAQRFSLDAALAFAAALYLILCVVVILAIRLRKKRGLLIRIGMAVLLPCLLMALAFSWRFYSVTVQKQAVVITDSADSRFEPFDDATTFFTLHEGEDVVVIESKGKWSKIRRLDGKRGWIKTEAIEGI